MIEDLTPEEFNILALALDFYLCNCEHDATSKALVEELFTQIDVLAEEAEDAEVGRIQSVNENLIVVNFQPKNG